MTAAWPGTRAIADGATAGAVGRSGSRQAPQICRAGALQTTHWPGQDRHQAGQGQGRITHGRSGACERHPGHRSPGAVTSEPVLIALLSKLSPPHVLWAEC